ncbi:TonB-dependent receptor [Mitsuaria sp. GD03876]|uniref:TonB-dependent receptor n=1 Tax=Mitsuaria sp. GD03876 TaxID=2975399 RepID=UPI00244A5670|nr:TonB-dependent receptor [Mitsuaria sp. GD03876]MDH0867344.1 TonB-dependent receptor [Mitsuaria sp. GD03876]
MQPSNRAPSAAPSRPASSGLRLSRLAGAARWVALGGLAALGGGAYAAEDAKPEAETRKLDTIVVTAQKRSESLKEVPMSVEAIDAEKLSAQGMVKLSDFFSQVPGLSYSPGSMSSVIVMRGIATNSGINVRPTSGVVIDDVPFGSATNTGVVPDLDPSDVRQIEVLRGPQGTLYGASSMGGLLKYNMTDPDTRRATRRVEAGLSSVADGGNGFTTRFAINQPVTDEIAVRLSAFKRRDPRYVHNLHSDEDNAADVFGGRIAAIWKITPALTVRASSLLQDTRSDGGTSVDVGYDLQPRIGEGTHDRMVGADSFHGRSRVSSIKVTADLGFGTLDAITGYNQSRQAAVQDASYTAIGAVAPGINAGLKLGLANPGVAIRNEFESNTKTQEVRLASRDDARLQWLVGAFYSLEHVNSTQNFFLAEKLVPRIIENPALLIAMNESRYRSRALFGDATYRFTDRFDLQFGARLARGRNRNTANNGGALTPAATTLSGNDDKDTTYLFSPRYRIDKNLMTYFRAASGFRAGGSNGVIPGSNIPPTFKSDKLNSYELGLKGTFLDQRLSLDGALYRIDWSDLQVSQVDTTFGGSYTTNAGKARAQGLELSAAWVPDADWKLTATYAFNDAKLTTDIPGFVEGQAAYGPRGARLPYSARQTLGATATRFFSLSDGMDLFVGANVNRVGAREMEFVQSSTLPRIHLPGYTLWGLNAGLQGSHWTLTMYVRNLTNEAAWLTAARRAPSLASGTSATLGATPVQPRTVGVTLTWDL